MARIIIENEGRTTVIENAVDWSIWDSEDVDGIVADYFKVELTEEEKQKLYCGVHHKCFKCSAAVEYDDLLDIVTEEMEKLGYERN